jgi:hypothetical protein
MLVMREDSSSPITLNRSKMRIVKQFGVVLLIALTIGIGSSKVSAQARASAKSSDISIGLLSLVIPPDFVLLQYEWRTSPVNSVALRAGFIPGYVGFNGFVFGGAYRFFIADSRALTGLSVAPGADVFIISSSGLGRSYYSFSFGGDIAYKWIFDAFSVEPIVTVRIGLGSSEGLSTLSGFRPGVDVLLGYAF